MSETLLEKGLCYDGTSRPVEVGDRVSWYGEEDARGTVVYIDEKKFVVRWDDIGEIEYGTDSIAALHLERKARKKK